MGNTKRGKCKAKFYQQVFKCMQLNNVLSVVTGTYLGGGGGLGFGVRGNHGGVGSRDVKWPFYELGFLVFSSLSTLRHSSV